ncbi:hypothetical protein EDC04DRAFT_2611367 [Pisolithus marmoratus]|nr:hypothetical protein EDC04DRAFT_2611367 [Pisolithus marmoratus]
MSGISYDRCAITDSIRDSIQLLQEIPRASSRGQSSGSNYQYQTPGCWHPSKSDPDKASAQLFPFRDLPLPQLSTADSGNKRLNSNNVYGEDNALHIGQEDSNNICQSPHTGDINLPSVLPNGNGHNNGPVHWDSPDLCISNDNDNLPAVLPSGNIVYGQDSNHLNIPNGDSHNTSPVHQDSPDLRIGNDDIDVDLPVMLLDDGHPNIENGDSNDACQVPHDLPNQCTGNDINLPALNSDGHNSGPVHQDSPDLCIGNDDDVDNLLATLLNGDDQDNDHSNIANGSRLIDSGTYRQDDGRFNTENEDCDNACQVPHDDDISDNMNVEGGDNWDAEGCDDANGNNRNGGHIDNAGNDTDVSDNDRESIHILDTDAQYTNEDYHADYDGEGEECHDGEDALWTCPEVPQGRQAGKQQQNNGCTAHGGKWRSCGGSCHGGSSSQQIWSGMDKDITLGQLLNDDQVALRNQSVTKGDLVVLASAILDLQDAITQCGTGDATSTVSKPLQPTSTVPEPMGDSDDPMPDYRKNRRQPLPKVASPNEMALYAATGQGGPTAENFYLDFHGPLASAWNKCAAKVFTSHFFDCGWYSSPKKDDIKRIFETHMHTLHAHSLLAMLPPNAMSGDETNHQPGQKQYAITKLTWQSQAVTEWLQAQLKMLPEVDLMHTTAILVNLNIAVVWQWYSRHLFYEYAIETAKYAYALGTHGTMPRSITAVKECNKDTTFIGTILQCSECDPAGCFMGFPYNSVEDSLELLAEDNHLEVIIGGTLANQIWTSVQTPVHALCCDRAPYLVSEKKQEDKGCLDTCVNFVHNCLDMAKAVANEQQHCSHLGVTTAMCTSAHTPGN